MGEHVLRGAPDIPLVMRVSGRARRMTLRVSHLDGRVTVTLPKGVPERQGLAFASEKEVWIRKHLAQRPDEVVVEDGCAVPIEGQMCQVVAGTGRKIERDVDRLYVPQNAVGRRVHAYLKTLARDRLAAASDLYAGQVGRSYTRMTLRDTRSRWGSCSSEGRLMFSWRLILAPPDVLRYVAAHEVSHLVHMNHSPAFWAQVREIFGPYEVPRRWLAQHGSRLHCYRFEN